jgi:predicted metal-dependent hydrolase
LYSTFADYIAILIEQYGHYKVQPDGRFIFADQSALQRFKNAQNLLNIAAKRVNDLEIEGKQLEKFQQEGWERFVKGQ